MTSNPTRLARNLLGLCAIATSIAIAIIAMPDGQQYLAAYATKLHKLRATPSPRVILVGGSSLAFGFDSSLARRELRTAIVNTGLHAGLGLKFMLEHTIPFVGAGDVVVLAPEYELLASKQAEDHGLWCTVLLSDLPETLAGFAWREVPELVAGFPDYAYRKLVVSHVARLFGSRSLTYDYTLAGFNSDGDEVGHLKEARRGVRLEATIDADITHATARLNEFIAEAHARGAQVIFVFAPIADTIYKLNRSRLDSIERELKASLDAPVVGTIHEGILADNQLFDTPYHPTAVGRILNTERMLSALRASKLLAGGTN